MKILIKILVIISIVIPTVGYTYFIIFHYFRYYLPNWFGDIGVRCFFISLYIIPFHLLTIIYLLTIEKYKLCVLLVICTICTLMILSKVAGDF